MPRPFDAGDVGWAPDAYHSGDPRLPLDDARPWLVLSRAETFPHHGDDYLCCALTSVPKPEDPCYVALQEADWKVGRPRKRSWVDAQTLVTLKHAWVAGYVGRISDEKRNRTRRIVKGFF